MLQEKEGLMVQVKDLEWEVDSLRNQNSDLENRIFELEYPNFQILIDGVPTSYASAVAESPERCKKNNKKAFERATEVKVPGRVKPMVAGGGVTVAQEGDRRRLLKIRIKYYPLII
ncbi:unnamed protein product [Camellia sinensis]